MMDKCLRTFAFIITGICALLAFAPFLAMLSVSLQSDSEIFSPTLVVIPAALRFDNYMRVFMFGNWPRYFFNSAVVTIISTVVSLIINSMAGYVFARISFRLNNTLFMIVLVGMMIPVQVTMIPVFTMLRHVPLLGGNDIFGQGGSGLYDTLPGLILPFIAGTFGVFLCRQYYVTIPKEIDDAAAIDGCGRFMTYLRLYIPLSGPLFASLGILKFAGSWNEYTWPLIMTRSDSTRTVQLALSLFRTESGIDWSRLMAASVMVSLPIFIVFAIAQKRFVAGLTAGSVKA